MARNSQLRKRWVALLIAMVCLSVVVGCSSPGATQKSVPANAASTTSSPTTKLCVFITKVNEAAGKVQSLSDGLATLKSFESQFNTQFAAAPKSESQDVKTVLDAARMAIAHNDLSPLATDSVAQAGERLTNACGLRAT